MLDSKINKKGEIRREIGQKGKKIEGGKKKGEGGGGRGGIT